MNVSGLLNGVCRRSLHTDRYTTRSVIRKENVAEHQWVVAFYSLVIRQWLLDADYIGAIDAAKLLMKCVVHDLEEAVTGDFLRKVKHANPEIHSAIEELGLQVVSEMDQELHLGQTIRDLWSNSKDDSIEGQIMRLADAMAVVAYVVEERKMGNRTLEDVVQEVLDHLNTGVAAKLENGILHGLCAETALYLCEQCEVRPHDQLIRKVEEFRERKNRNRRC